MSNTQYAVCHLQRGSGNDSGMSCHIERKDAKGKVYVPANADANRTQLNRELIAFPAGVKNRTDAIQFRIDHAGLHRKVGKNQTKAIRIILTGTHEQMNKYEEDIARLQADIEQAKEGKSTVLSWFGKGDLAKAKKELASKDEQIAKLKSQIKMLMAEKAQLQEKHKSEIEQLRNGYQKEIDKAIHRAESAEQQSKEKDSVIDRQNQRIDLLDRKANPHRYQLSSGAELVHYNISNMRNPSIHIWTKVGNEEYDTRTYIEYFSDIWERFSKNEATAYELINEGFEPHEQVNEVQANLAM